MNEQENGGFDWLPWISLASAILVSAAVWRCVYLYIWKGLLHQ